MNNVRQECKVSFDIGKDYTELGDSYQLVLPLSLETSGIAVALFQWIELQNFYEVKEEK